MGSYIEFDNERGLNINASSLKEWLERNPIPNKIQNFVSIDEKGFLIFDEDPMYVYKTYFVKEIDNECL